MEAGKTPNQITMEVMLSELIATDCVVLGVSERVKGALNWLNGFYPPEPKADGNSQNAVRVPVFEEMARINNNTRTLLQYVEELIEALSK